MARRVLGGKHPTAVKIERCTDKREQLIAEEAATDDVSSRLREDVKGMRMRERRRASLNPAAPATYSSRNAISTRWSRSCAACRGVVVLRIGQQPRGLASRLHGAMYTWARGRRHPSIFKTKS